MWKAWQHFCVITRHKALVMKYCFRVGLYKQGLLHDLSKYSWTEFRVGCRYFQGNRSPNNAEREQTGVSTAWLHHKGRNRHHLEYWTDYSVDPKRGYGGVKMPKKYIIEMLMDRIAASRIYLKDAYTDRSPLEYYLRGRAKTLMHEDTSALLEHLLNYLAEHGEDETFLYIRRNILIP